MTSIAAAFLLATPLATQDAPPRTVGDVFQPGEQAVWIFEADGKPIGEHASRYVGVVELPEGEAHLFHGQVRLELGPPLNVELRTAADLWTDDGGHPLRFVQQALVGESYSRVELSASKDDARALVVQGASAERSIPVRVDPAAYLLANNFVSHIEILLALEAPAGNAALKLFSASTLQVLPYELKVGEAFEEELDGRTVRGRLFTDSLGERLRVADGRLLAVELPGQKLVIRRSATPSEPAASITPIVITAPERSRALEAFDVEEVAIEHGDARIAGLVTRTKGPHPEGTRFPAVFFVSGSGAQDRNGTSSGIDLGTHEILDRLTAEGFLVLRVDDRGAGMSSALPPDSTFDDLVADARTCVDYLVARPDVDPRRVTLIGHSEGGETVPILAAERPEIAALVLMAAPGRSIVAIMEEQNRQALEELGLEGDALEEKMSGISAFLRLLASDAEIDPASVDPELRAGLAMRAWVRSHARQDPLANVKRVRCPVLILQGGKDFQVSAERDAKALEAALDDARHPDHELRVFPALDHLFKRSPGERSQLADYWLRRPVDPEMLDVMSGWLRARLLPETR